jgi:hypothetical protein
VRAWGADRVPTCSNSKIDGDRGADRAQRDDISGGVFCMRSRVDFCSRFPLRGWPACPRGASYVASCCSSWRAPLTVICFRRHAVVCPVTWKAQARFVFVLNVCLSLGTNIYGKQELSAAGLRRTLHRCFCKTQFPYIFKNSNLQINFRRLALYRLWNPVF